MTGTKWLDVASAAMDRLTHLELSSGQHLVCLRAAEGCSIFCELRASIKVTWSRHNDVAWGLEVAWLLPGIVQESLFLLCP